MNEIRSFFCLENFRDLLCIQMKFSLLIGAHTVMQDLALPTSATSPPFTLSMTHQITVPLNCFLLLYFMKDPQRA